MPKIHPIAIIMLAVLVWGIFHAIGAYTFNWNIYRPLMVLGCSLGFLGFWALMLRNRKRRLARRNESLGPRS
ncbi:MAG: hypothetical protein ACKO85_10550 [Isosphaeraceae bacterium]